MATRERLQRNAQAVMTQVAVQAKMKAEPEIRGILFLFNAEEPSGNGPVAMCANVPRERVRQVLKDFLKNNPDPNQSNIILPFPVKGDLT